MKSIKKTLGAIVLMLASSAFGGELPVKYRSYEEKVRTAVEHEISDDKDIEKHKGFLRELLDKLGSKEEDKIEKSITYLYMEEFSFKE